MSMGGHQVQFVNQRDSEHHVVFELWTLERCMHDCDNWPVTLTFVDKVTWVLYDWMFKCDT